MKRKMISIMLLVVLSCSVIFTGCKNNNENDAKGNGDVLADSSITIINSKGEVKPQIEELAAAFTKDTGIEVEVITTNPGVDVQATTKGLYLSDHMPDIIVCEASDFSNWDGLLVDMSAENWTSKTDAAYVDTTYGTLGFPYTTEAIGFAYNKNILDKAGIDPATLTSPKAYKQAFAKLDSMKSELGLKAVVGYCAEPENLGWSSGNHIFGAYLDSGLSREDTTYIDLFNQGGKLDQTRALAFADFIGMLNKYSDPSLLTNGVYDDQVRNFAAGKYAFITQGSWIGATLTGDAASEYAAAGNFEVGMAPYAFLDGQDTILTSAPAWWAVAKEGNVEAAKAFLQWCSEDAGQKILIESAGFVSPFTDCKYAASDPFAPTITSYVTEGKTSNWHWMDMKAGIGQNSICYCFSDYAKGKLNKESFVKELEKSSEQYYKN